MTVVVAAVIVRDHLVLAARRRRPAELAGGWEFPGGKVEPGESETDAVARECREELEIDVEPGDFLAAAPIRAGLTLRAYLAGLTGAQPAAGADHDALRWLHRDELDDIAWLPADRLLLPAVAAALS